MCTFDHSLSRTGRTKFMSYENREGKALPNFANRVRKNFTISAIAIRKLSEKAKAANLSMSRYLENLILDK